MKVRIYEKCQIMEVVNSNYVFFGLSEPMKSVWSVDSPSLLISPTIKTERFPIRKFPTGNFIFVDKDLRDLMEGLEETTRRDQEQMLKQRQSLNRIYNMGFWNRVRFLWNPKKRMLLYE